MRLLSVFGVLILAIVADCGVSMHNPLFCYMTDPIRSMAHMFNYFTSYEAIRRFNFTTVNPYISTCTPSRFWYLGRYGGLFPTRSAMRNMTDLATSSIQADIVSNYESGRTTLCREDFEAIRDWAPQANFTIENASLTSEAGILAMVNIARRFQQVFPQLLTETYSYDRFLFRHTSSERTNTSIRSFATGLFGEIGSQNVVYEDVPINDWFLEPFYFCPVFDQEVDDWNNPSQASAFQSGPEFDEMLKEVNRKLGFSGANQLSLGTVETMSQWCIFETSSKFEFSNSEAGGDSPWCAVFSVAHHFLFEYFQDLYHFYTAGYGVRNRRLLENHFCGLMQDLLTHMQSGDGQTVRVYVTKAQEILGMLVTLEAFKDTCCDDGDHDLIFLLNERPILVPGCDQQTGVCKLSVFVNRFQRFVDANCETLFCSSY